MIKIKKINQLNTSFAQNILSKYGIGRWKGQFTRLIFRNNSHMVSESGEEKKNIYYTETKRFNNLLKVYKYLNNSSPKIVLLSTTHTVSLKPSYNIHDKTVNITSPTEIKLYTKTEPTKLIQKVILNNNKQEQKNYFHKLTEKTELASSDVFTEVRNSATNHNKYVYHVTDIKNNIKNVFYDETDTKLIETEKLIKEAPEHTYQNILEKEITYKKDYEKQTVVREIAQKPVMAGNNFVGQHNLNTLVYNVFPITKPLGERLYETFEGTNIKQSNINQRNIKQRNISQSNINQQNINQRNISQSNIIKKNISQRNIDKRIINQSTFINNLITKEKYQPLKSGELNTERVFAEEGFPTQDIIHSIYKQQINRNIFREHEIKEMDLDEYEKFVHFLPKKNDKIIDLVFYRPQMKEKDKKEHEIKEILPMDVMQAEKKCIR
ncbi:hypothetical protein [Ruminiclostridium josui]|uniref:hypothetical protein n=1 Tax=Ruminiclostridium josui TaxID=1499 RepID=UPI0009ECC207|nr:hypothetical protein [Ruminiclostridium josui]